MWCITRFFCPSSSAVEARDCRKKRGLMMEEMHRNTTTVAQSQYTMKEVSEAEKAGNKRTQTHTDNHTHTHKETVKVTQSPAFGFFLRTHARTYSRTHTQQTHSSLSGAARTKRITNKPIVQMDPKDILIMTMRQVS